MNELFTNIEPCRNRHILCSYVNATCAENDPQCSVTCALFISPKLFFYGVMKDFGKCLA